MGGRAVISDEEDEVEEEERVMEKDAEDLEDRGVDDEEEEEDEEGQDEYEKDGFIVDDVEEEEEEEEEEEDKQDSDEERHRKKKKKRRDSERNYVLDDDDYELLQDNIGFHRPQHGNKFKRLKKAGRDTDVEERSGFLDEEEESDRHNGGGRTAEEKLKRSLFGDDDTVPLEDIAEEDQPEEEEVGDMDEDEMADFIVDEEDVDETGTVVRKKKTKKKKSRQTPGISSSALQEAHDIFGDVDELLQRRKEKLTRGVGDGDWGVKRLEDEFEPLIISEKYMTPNDDKIREVDIPERMQLSEEITGPHPTDPESSEEESTWIYNQLTGGLISPLVGHDQLVIGINKDHITSVLQMLHHNKYDIPFISMYRKENCGSLLKDPDVDMQDGQQTTRKMKWHKVLWAVHTLDKKWLLLHKRKTALQKYYLKRSEEESRRIDDETRLALNKQLLISVSDALKEAKSEREVDDIDAKFNLHFPPGEVDSEEGQFKRPKRKSWYSVCHKAGLWEVASKFGANSELFGSLLSLERVISDELEDGKETPEEIATNFTCAMFETPQDVLKGARHMAAVEIGCEPNVKKHVRTIFMEKAVVSTTPTTEGNLIIDSHHQLAGVKWLRNKPLSEFVDLQWLLIHKGEEEKLLRVTVKLPEDVQKKLLSDASECYLSECVSRSAQLWNEQRKMILEDSFVNFILPSMEKEARSMLAARAKNWLLLEYGKQLWDRVSLGPFKRKDAEDSEDEPGARVMACCWGPGKPATTIVMLDSAGEMVDVLYAGSISIRSQGVAEQQRKKNDQQRVLKFMTDHQPHAVCVGAANVACRQLKDDIYEVIFKIVEDHPKDVSQDFEAKIVMGDESLPRLYENSRISSDQLPGQPGIVKRAVALGRYLQNPLAMIATLCGPGKEILSWKLCPLEEFLTADEKYEMIEQVMVDATNQIGLDINLATSHEWLFAPLQFVSGLGPRKASALQRAFVRAGSIFNRKEIPMGKILKKKVFINAVGFLRVRRSGAAAASSHLMDLLDDTRIHPESYEIAKNLAKDVYAEDAPNEANDMDDDVQEMAIEHVRERPDMLIALDIDEYAKSFYARYGTDKRATLYDIKMELLHGFQDWRAPYNPEQNNEEVYNMLFGTMEDTISEGRIVQVTVRTVQENRIICAFDSGLKGMISAEDFSDDACNLVESVHEGDILTCKIKHINKVRLMAYLTCKGSDLRRRTHKIRNLDPYYHEDPSSLRSDQEKACKEKELAKKHFKPRMIVHPRFQNLTANEAMEHLSDKEPGESIIRPSSKGPLFLTLTLKIFDGVYAHKEIVEGGKDHKDVTGLLRLGKTLTIDKDTFEDLDEVMDRYVDPLVSHLKDMLAYRKFRRGSKAEVDDLLRTEKAENPMRIVYCFGISHEHPGTFILSYIRSSNPHHEYVGLYPKGFRFRKKDFDNIDHLVAYFQKNIDKLPPDTGPSLGTLAAVVPYKSPAWNSSGGGSVSGASPGSNEGWKDGRFDSRNSGSRDGHLSGLPKPGRGRGRGRGQGNNFGNDARDSDFGAARWDPVENNGLSSFPGAKAQNSPGRERFPGGWNGRGSGGGRGGNSSRDNDGGGSWGSSSSVGKIGGSQLGSRDSSRSRGGGVGGSGQGSSGGSGWGAGSNSGGSGATNNVGWNAAGNSVGGASWNGNGVSTGGIGVTGTGWGGASSASGRDGGFNSTGASSSGWGGDPKRVVAPQGGGGGW